MPEKGTIQAFNARIGRKGVLHATWCRDELPLTPQDLWTPHDPHLPHHSLFFTHSPITSTPLPQKPLTYQILPFSSPFTSILHKTPPTSPSKFKPLSLPNPPIMAEPYTPSPLLYKPIFTPSFSHNLNTTSPPWPNHKATSISSISSSSTLFFLLLLEDEQTF